MPGTDLHSKAPDDLFSVDNLFSLGDEVNLIDSGMSTLNSLSSHISYRSLANPNQDSDFNVLEFSNENTRNSVLFVCKRYARMLTTEASFRWRLERLHIEDGIYSSIPNQLDCNGDSLKTTFLNLRTKRMLWRAHEQMQNGEQVPPSSDAFHIHVSVRFKPITIGSNKLTKQVTLPLHQKLALIKFENNLRTNSDALSILKQEGSWFKDKWTAEVWEDKDNMEPTNSERNESESPPLSCGIKTIDCKNKNVVIVDPTKGLRKFHFNSVLAADCSQTLVYDESTKRHIGDFINGLNASVLVYGVTGSGKTHTMFGDCAYSNNTCRGHKQEEGMDGIVPRACKEIFDALAYRKKQINMKIESSVAISFIEIYGNQISDLLQKGAPCCPNKAASQRFVLSGAAEVPVGELGDVVQYLSVGEKQKRKASTAMNERSSRAHSIFIVTLNQTNVSTGVSRTSKLFLVDLGGCEQTKKSDIGSGSSKHFERLKKETMSVHGQDGDKEHIEVDDKYSTGFVQSQRMREAVNINLGLLSLKNCVNALTSGNTKYIPYADSKLTMMLSTALGGCSKTSVIVCAAQDVDQVPETIAAIKFGQSCRSVTNEVQTESGFLKQLLDDLDAEIAECEIIIKKKERWEVKVEERKDVLAENNSLESEGFGGVEVRKTTVLVGAEEERKLLGKLLRKKAELLGQSIDSSIGGKKFGGAVGFGVAHTYGMGERSREATVTDAYRFGHLDNFDIPDTVKNLGGKGWNILGSEKEEDEDGRIKQMKKKSTLVYSGISA